MSYTLRQRWFDWCEGWRRGGIFNKRYKIARLETKAQELRDEIEAAELALGLKPIERPQKGDKWHA